MLTERFVAAFDLAADLHSEQRRKGGDIPYLAHLMAVASLVLEHGGDEDEAVAALLHDAIEDQATRRGGADALRTELSQRFGARVLTIVDACTETRGHPKPPWRERKEQMMQRIATNPDAGFQRVACADKLHNVRSVLADHRAEGKRLWARFTCQDPEAHLWHFRGLTDAFRAAGAAPEAMIDELDRMVSELEHRIRSD